MSSSNTASPSTLTDTSSDPNSARAKTPQDRRRFSQADTLVTSDSAYTGNTAGRARVRVSWRNNMQNMWLRSVAAGAPSSVQPNDRETSVAIPTTASRSSSLSLSRWRRRSTIATTTSSPTDPYLEIARESQFAHRQLGHTLPSPAVELPASPVAQPGPQSWFDDTSDSESDENDDEHLSHSHHEEESVISRASSVRVQRPQIVENHSIRSRGLSLYTGSRQQQHQHPAGLAGVYDGTTAEEMRGEVDADVPATTTKTPSDAANFAQIAAVRAYVGSSIDQVSGGPSEALKALTANATLGEEKQEVERPEASTSSSLGNTVLEVPDTPTRREALDTLPTPLGGFGAMPMMSSGRLDGLRSNPTSHDETNLASGEEKERDGWSSLSSTTMMMRRALSAPMPRLGPLKPHHPHRKVTIRPSDLIILPHDHGDSATSSRVSGYPPGRSGSGFRESFVSTPYPRRMGSLSLKVEVEEEEEEEEEDKDEEKEKENDEEEKGQAEVRMTVMMKSPLSPETEKVDGVVSTPPQTHQQWQQQHQQQHQHHRSSEQQRPVSGGHDRFPSPFRGETLVMYLALAPSFHSHLSSTTTTATKTTKLTIPITDRATFDDEALFHHLRRAYTTDLLGGRVRRVCASARTLVGASCLARRWSRGRTEEAGIEEDEEAERGGEFDAADFVRHLREPRVGRRRKTWVVWLRRMQRSSHFDTTIALARTVSVAGRPQQRIDHTVGGPVVGGGIGGGIGSGAAIAASSPPTQTFLLSPSTICSLPAGMSSSLSPSPEHTATSFTHDHRPNPLSSSSSPSPPSPYSSSPSPPSPPPTPPIIYLHHGLSLPRLLTALSLTLLLSVTAAVLWVIFGVLGGHPSQAQPQPQKQTQLQIPPQTPANVGSGVGSGNGNGNWRVDAQARVLTGLVLGVLVLLLGVLVDAVWVVAGSWVVGGGFSGHV